MGLAIDLAVTHDAWNGIGDLARLAENAVGAALRVGGVTEALDEAEVSLLLCDDAFIRTLNRQWRGQDKPTNVLSFPAPPTRRSDPAPPSNVSLPAPPVITLFASLPTPWKSPEPM